MHEPGALGDTVQDGVLGSHVDRDATQAVNPKHEFTGILQKAARHKPGLSNGLHFAVGGRDLVERQHAFDAVCTDFGDANSVVP